MHVRFSLSPANVYTREEQKPLEEFFEAKKLKTRNEMLDDVRLNPYLSCNILVSVSNRAPQSSTLIAQALNDVDMASSDEEVVAPADRGSADEDDESVDEDFQEDSESDVAEEFDSAHESSGGSDDEEMAGGDDAKGAKSKGPPAEERPKKKVKTAK